jgi:MoaA/NifB/PqqE/SkfB family radical SAM enzyme
MAEQDYIPKFARTILTKTPLSSNQLTGLVKKPFVQKLVFREAEKFMFNQLRQSRSNPHMAPGIQEDQTSMSLAILGSLQRAFENNRLSESYLDTVVNVLVKTLLIEKGDWPTREAFREKYGFRSPSFLVVSPGKACNLRCTGCYADADNRTKALDWSILSRMVDEAKTLWGSRFIVISGGEPFAYRSEGKGFLELIEQHPDCFFIAYTNGTLITDKVSKRLAKSGNMLPCISVEGWRETTDRRRGPGVFDKILETMARLREDQVPFGLSFTATRNNAEELLSEEFIDFFIDQGALMAWLFQYMPIGRAFTLDLMVTPEQRAWMWKQSWELVREKRFLIADFWNHGTCVDGCLSAGGHGNGGYFYIDWNGAISPCVFVPYSPLNIKDVYARGDNLNDVWQDPFFAALRQWQVDYKKNNRNGLTPCPNRDHHDELEKLLYQYEPDPTDTNAFETLVDPGYTEGLVAYNQKYEQITKDIWENHYLNRKVEEGELLTPLPEIPQIEDESEQESQISIADKEELSVDR